MVDEEHANESVSEEVGGRKRRRRDGHDNHTKKHHNKNAVVVGKVYAEWCGHCQSLKPEWKKMKHRIHTKKGNMRVVFVEIEEKEMNHKLKQLEKKHGVVVASNGYPTLFRVENGKVTYYNGNRTSEQMAEWYLNGNENAETNNIPEPMPMLMQDVQGGSRRRRRRPHYRSNRFYTNKYHHKNNNTGSTEFPERHTRRHSTPKKKSGIFDFLFGK